MIAEILNVLLIFLGIAGWILYSEERQKSRDYATDLSTLIHSHDLDSRDLRRSLRHKEIRREIERTYKNDGTYEFLAENTTGDS